MVEPFGDIGRETMIAKKNNLIILTIFSILLQTFAGCTSLGQQDDSVSKNVLTPPASSEEPLAPPVLTPSASPEKPSAPPALTHPTSSREADTPKDVPSLPKPKPQPSFFERMEKESFAPKAVSGDDSYNRAYTIYRSSSGKPTGVHVWHGTVFVIVNINLKKENLKYVKGTAMLRAKALLQKKFHLPSSFKLVCRELEARTYRNQGFFRYALAYREADIIQLAESSDIQ